jgi:hypothetical protein
MVSPRHHKLRILPCGPSIAPFYWLGKAESQPETETSGCPRAPPAAWGSFLAAAAGICRAAKPPRSSSFSFLHLCVSLRESRRGNQSACLLCRDAAVSPPASALQIAPKSYQVLSTRAGTSEARRDRGTAGQDCVTDDPATSLISRWHHATSIRPPENKTKMRGG